MSNNEVKIIKKYAYHGLGFKVVLLNARLVRMEGDWVLDLDVNKIAEAFAQMVPLKPAALTGRELRFLRRHHGMTQDELAKALEATRQSIINWEKAMDAPAGLTAANERLVRIYFLRKTRIRGALLERGLDLILFQRSKRTNANYQISPDKKPTENLKLYIEKQAA